MGFGSEDDGGIELIDPEDFRNPEDNKFNHQTLVMISMKKVLENGSVELREGWWEQKPDSHGNITKVYHEDTRRKYIESVKTLMNIMYPDYTDDKEYNPKINKLLENIQERKRYWQNEEWNEWCKLSPASKQQRASQGKDSKQGRFNKELEFDNYYFDDELNIYRDIFALLNNLTKKLHYYGNDMFTA